MASRSRGRVGGLQRRGGSQLRPLEWDGVQVGGGVSANTRTAAWALDPTTVDEVRNEPTLMRSLHALQIRNVTSPAAGAFAGFAIGLIVALGDPGSATVPTPFPFPWEDPNAYCICMAMMPVAPAAGAGTLMSLGVDRWVESQARRRLGNGEGILVVAEAIAVAFDFSYSTRLLVKV